VLRKTVGVILLVGGLAVRSSR